MRQMGKSLAAPRPRHDATNHDRGWKQDDRSCVGVSVRSFRARRARRVLGRKTSGVVKVTIPDLASYDVIEVSSSAGKDSLASISYVVDLARAAGVIDRVVVVHSDLGRVEWKRTREIAIAQAEHFGVRWMVVSRAQGDLLALARHYGHWPRPSSRWCTAMLKRGQILRALTQLADEARGKRAHDDGRPVRVLNCIGLRAEESPSRRRQKNFRRDPRSSGKGERKVVDIWLPIQDLTEAEVWTRCHASGAPIHPAYALGMPRLSCVFCIFAPEAALQLAGLENPELLAEYVEVEREIKHDFKHHLPLAKVQADLAAGVRPEGAIKSWCM